MSNDKMKRDFETYWTSREMGENNTRMGGHCFENWCTWQAALSQSKPAQVSQTARKAPVFYADKTTINGFMIDPYSRQSVIGLRIGEYVNETDIPLYLAPPDYEALKENTKLLDGMLSKVIEERNNAEQSMCKLKADLADMTSMADGTLASYDKLKAENEALKAENESLKLRVAELEENILHVTEKRDYFEQIRRTCAEMTMKLTADNVRLQSECDRLRIVEFDGALNKAGWTFLEALPSYDNNTFNFVKKALKVAIEKWISVKEQEK